MIIQQAEELLNDNEYKISSAHILQLVNSSSCSAYDCEFVALAQYLDIPLITADKKILEEFQKLLNHSIFILPKDSGKMPAKTRRH